MKFENYRTNTVTLKLDGTNFYALPPGGALTVHCGASYASTPNLATTVSVTGDTEGLRLVLHGGTVSPFHQETLTAETSEASLALKGVGIGLMVFAPFFLLHILRRMVRPQFGGTE